MARDKGQELPRTLSHDTAKRLLERNGWVATIGGKHSTKMEKEGRRPITLPRHRGQDYGARLRGEILKQAGLKSPAAEVEDVDSASGETG